MGSQWENEWNHVQTSVHYIFIKYSCCTPKAGDRVHLRVALDKTAKLNCKLWIDPSRDSANG